MSSGNQLFNNFKDQVLWTDGKISVTINFLFYLYFIVIIHLENHHRKINTLEEIEILTAASSENLLNDITAGQNGPM